MPSIEDLKTNNNYTGNGTASGTDDGVMVLANPNIKNPKLKPTPQKIDFASQPRPKPPVGGPAIMQSMDSKGTLTIHNPNIKRGNIDLDTLTDTSGPVPSAPPKRKIADLSSLPSGIEKDPNIHESIEADIFAEGGPFDQYIEKKSAEMNKINALIDEHNAAVAAARNEEMPTDQELQEMGDDKATDNMTAAIIGTEFYDQADNWSRRRGKIKQSPLEDGLVNNAEYNNQVLQELKEGTIDSTLNTEDLFKDDNYVDPLEEELSKDFNKSKKKIERSVFDMADNNIQKNDDKVMTNAITDHVSDEAVSKILQEAKVQENKPTTELTAAFDNKADTADSLAGYGIQDVHTIETEEDQNIIKPASAPIEQPKAPKPVTNSPILDESSQRDLVNRAKTLSADNMTTMEFDEEDLADLEGEALSERGNATVQNNSEIVEMIDEEENANSFGKEIAEKIKPISEKLNLAGFSIISKPITVSFSSLEEDNMATMNWLLPNTWQYISMSEFSGKEIEQLVAQTSGLTPFEQLRQRYKLFYDHLTSKKPDSLEAWIKSISFNDASHLFFAAYGANFSDSNYVSYTCPKCGKNFLTDHMPISTFLKYKDDETEKKCYKIVSEQRNDTNSGLYRSEIIPISNKIAIGFRDPSLYTVVFESTLMDDKFRRKYQDMLAIMMYVDQLYKIDMNNHSLVPIGCKVFPNDPTKTAKTRIITYSKILSKLSPDQYYIIVAYINAIATKEEPIKFIKPSATCPHCGSSIEESDADPLDLLSTRSQLMASSVASIN